MPDEWIASSLGQLIDIRHGYAFKGEFFHDEPIGDILLTPGNFQIGGGFKDDKVKYYDGPVPDEFVLQEGDLLLTMTDLSKASDTLGYPAVVPRRTNARRYLHNQRLGKVEILNPSLLDIRFVHYLLRTREYRNEVLGSATGTTVKHTSPERIKRFRFMRPPLDEQRAIACILGALDDKIELNRRMNETMEAIAQAIFKSWFVDAIRDGLPEGWRIGTMRECCERIENGGTPRRNVEEYWFPQEIPWLTSGEVRQRIIIETQNFISKKGFENSSAKLWPVGTTVVALYGATAGQVTLLATEMSANQACCALIPRKDARSYVYLTALSAVSKFEQQATGSAQQNLSQGLVSSLPTVIPKGEIVSKFEAIVSPMIARWIRNLKEAQSLAALRDALLPKLISGELPLPNAERILARCA